MKKHLVIALASFALLGCDSDSSSSEDTQTISSDVEVISEDRYVAIDFTLERSAAIQLEARLIDGPSIEIYMLGQQAYNTWETAVANGQLTTTSFNFYQDLSIAPLASEYKSEWRKLEEGRYYLIIENTDYGNTAPNLNGVDDKATVEYSLFAR
ncbi:MAG: hypothetical protein ACQES2_08630 [Pseudomonadota bacterium]